MKRSMQFLQQILAMKYQKQINTPRLQEDAVVMLAFVIAFAGLASLIPVVLSPELAQVNPTQPVLLGEAGLWAELGARDERLR